MLETFHNLLRAKLASTPKYTDKDFEELGIHLKTEIFSIFGRSLALREVDSGSDSAAEIELNNLTNAYYDIERFGITFVASPRHADGMVITGAVTLNMELAVRKTYEVMPAPKFVIAVGDDACSGGLFRDTYAVRGGADLVVPVDIKIPGNPPSPSDIMKGLIILMQILRRKGH
jgi:Ni,Fe-hydrogenase III small subunit